MSWLATANGTAPSPCQALHLGTESAYAGAGHDDAAEVGRRRPSMRSMSGSHVRVRGSIICAVEAMVYSVTASPVSR